jgi:DNA-directed RNA polymerase sigma subunit (sigma70/sigma32)
MIRRLPKLRRLMISMAQELLREPTREELAVRMKMPEHAIETMIAYDSGPRELPSEISGLGSGRRGDTLADWDLLRRRKRVRERYAL